MPPQNQYPQYPQTPQPNNGQYDFILAPQSPRGPSVFSNPKQLLMLLAGLVVLIVAVVIIISSLSGSKSDNLPFITLAQDQQEMARVADLGYGDAASQSVKNFAITTKLSITTDQTKLTSYLKENGVKVSSKALSQSQDSAHDTALASAKSTSSVDSTLTQILTQELTDYQTALKQLYAKTTNPSTKSLLGQLYDDASLLLAQSKQ